ncbi:hypothetical protein NLN82_27925 [Citrobacter portucalensis]|uniref:hypothetical protein n=1 Tax=Citrobacter portucalensis TaxID=1639133 RepID=UPI00226B1E14|nr:hypothetical protein [Citrobacter portucalensis]MCX9039822.1 hypothetical protein [Citrobacter portucalensis]
MSTISEQLKEYDLDQLRSLRDNVVELINSKQEEEKKTVWRVVDRYLCWGNFREDEYLLAVACLADKAKELHAEPTSDRCDRELQIVAKRVAISEYEAYFIA